MTSLKMITDQDLIKTLSKREYEIATLIALGFTELKEIAWQLGTTHGTVKVTLNRMYIKLGKFGITNRMQLALAIGRAGL